MSAKTVSSFLKKRQPTRGYTEELNMFTEIINFKKLRYGSEDLVPNSANTILFGNLIRSDGFSVDCVFYKRRQSVDKPNDDLKLDHFNYDEIQASYNPLFLDPGRKSVFTAVSGLDTKAHTVMRCTTKEYYHLTGSTKFSSTQNKLKKASNIEEIESKIPTTKTSDPKAYLKFMEYILQHLDVLFGFYNAKTRKYHFFLYQGKQRAGELMVNMLVGGGAKYNKRKRKHKNKKKKRQKKKKEKKEKKKEKKKEEESRATDTKKENRWRPLKYEENRTKVPLVVFGDGLFGKDHVRLKGNRVGVSGILYRCLKKREREGGLIAVTIDEFRTSRICNGCRSDSLKSAGHIRGNSVLECTTCNILWQRDVNAAKNMLAIGVAIWRGVGRPSEFSRK